MTRFQKRFIAESNRKKYWDYSSSGYYFLTICTFERECFLGKIVDEKMVLSEYGNLVKNEIIKIPKYHQSIVLDEWVIMPDHIHLLIQITKLRSEDKIHEFYQPEPMQWWRNQNYKPSLDEIKEYRKQRRKMIIPKIVGKLKMQTSKQINVMKNTPGIKNWQHDYNDQIFQDEKIRWAVKKYIINNPINSKKSYGR